jgi:hypothetical protein
VLWLGYDDGSTCGSIATEIGEEFDITRLKLGLPREGEMKHMTV